MNINSFSLIYFFSKICIITFVTEKTCSLIISGILAMFNNFFIARLIPQVITISVLSIFYSKQFSEHYFTYITIVYYIFFIVITNQDSEMKNIFKNDISTPKEFVNAYSNKNTYLIYSISSIWFILSFSLSFINNYYIPRLIIDFYDLITDFSFIYWISLLIGFLYLIYCFRFTTLLLLNFFNRI